MIKLRGISESQSKIVKFEEYYNYLFGGELKKECDKHIIRSIIHEMFLQKVHKSTLTPFDEKICCLT